MRTHGLLAAVDFSAESERAAVLAVARARRAGAALTLVHVDHVPLGRAQEGHREACAARLGELATRLRRELPAVDIETRVLAGDPSDGIVALAGELQASAIVMATRGSGATQYLLGSVAAHVAQRAPCPVLIADREEASAPDGCFRRVLCGIDDSAFAPVVAELAVGFADPDGVIELGHVWRAPRLTWLRSRREQSAVRERLEQAARQRLQDLGTARRANHAHIETWVSSGPPAGALLDRAMATKADLIVIGAHSRTRAERVLGTVADRVLRYATCAVLVVPAPALEALTSAQHILDRSGGGTLAPGLRDQPAAGRAPTGTPDA